MTFHQEPEIGNWPKKQICQQQRLVCVSAVNDKIYAIGCFGLADGAFAVVKEYDSQTSKSIDFKGELLNTWSNIRIATSG